MSVYPLFVYPMSVYPLLVCLSSRDQLSSNSSFFTDTDRSNNDIRPCHIDHAIHTVHDCGTNDVLEYSRPMRHSNTGIFISVLWAISFVMTNSLVSASNYVIYQLIIKRYNYLYSPPVVYKTVCLWCISS